MSIQSQVPEGYSVTPAYGGTWQWESILDPECHAANGFPSEEAAVKSCRASNGLDEEEWVISPD